MSVLSDYKVRFFVSGAYGSSKAISTSNDVLSSYIVNHYTIEDANRLLGGIIKVLNNQIPLAGDTSRGMVEGVIDSSWTKLYHDAHEFWDDQSITPDFQLPTLHFKAIVEAWINYLEQ